jgi:hypothetical protein
LLISFRHEELGPWLVDKFISKNSEEEGIDLLVSFFDEVKHIELSLGFFERTRAGVRHLAKAC